jgi:CheY-like chemotaxis protein
MKVRCAAYGWEILARVAEILGRLFSAIAEDPTQLNPSKVRTLAKTLDFLTMALKPETDRSVIEDFPVRALAVDDNAICLRSIVLALHKGEIRLDAATHPDEALEYLQDNTYDLVFTDVMMPQVDGFEFARKLRQLPGHAHTSLVFVTALSDLQARSQSALVGGCDFITKPIDPGELALKAWTIGLSHRIEEKARRNGSAARRSLLSARGPMRGGGLLHLDENGLIQSITQPTAGIFGYLVEDLVGLRFTLLFPPDLQTQPALDLLNFLHAPGEQGHRSVMLLGRHRDQRLVLTQVSAFRNKVSGQFQTVIILRPQSASLPNGAD